MNALRSAVCAFVAAAAFGCGAGPVRPPPGGQALGVQQGAEVFVAPGNYRVRASVTTPAGVRYRFAPGASVTVDPGATITFSGEIEAAKSLPIFSGGGSVTFAFGSQREVYPDWWGSGADAVQAACDAALPARIPVQLLPHAYRLGPGGLRIDSPYAVVRGAGGPAIGYVSAVRDATNTPPIGLSLFQTTGLVAGQPIYVLGVGGNTAANGLQTAGALTPTTVALAGTRGNGVYTSGGSVSDAGGSVLLYEGSGTAVAVGVDVGRAHTFLNDVKLADFRIQCVDSTAIGLDLWWLAEPRVERVHVHGLSGESQSGIRETSCIQPHLEQCNVLGYGSQSDPAKRLPTCLSITGTTVAKGEQCYFHGCQTGVRVTTSFAEFSSTVFEDDARGFFLDQGAIVTFDACHWEDVGNATTEGVGLVNPGCFAQLNDPVVVLYPNASTMFTPVSVGGVAGSSVEGRIKIEGGYVAGSKPVTALAPHAALASGFDVEVDGTWFAGGPAIATLSGAGVSPIAGTFESPPGFEVGQTVHVTGAQGNTAANGWHRVTSVGREGREIAFTGTGNGTYVPKTGQMLAWGIIDRPGQGASGEAGDWRSVSSPRQKVLRYAFVKPHLGARQAVAAALLDGAESSLSFTMPAAGWILGLEASYSTRATGGTIRVTASLEDLPDVLDTKSVSATSLPVSVHRTITSMRAEKGERVACSVRTDGQFAPAGGDLTVEVFIALGDP